MGMEAPEHAAAVTAADLAEDRPPEDRLLGGLRRLMRLADEASEPEAVFRALAGELFSLLGADEVHVHHLAPAGGGSGTAGLNGHPALPATAPPAGADDQDLVVVYLFGGEARLSYRTPRAERPAGVAWVAGTGQSVLATGTRELAASVPRLAVTGGVGCALLLALTVRGEVEVVVVVAQRGSEPLGEHAIQQAAVMVDQAANGLALLRARAEAGTDAVTGCMNHRAMLRRLHEEIGRAARTDASLACLLIDLDDFKAVNDRHGHQAGDAVLREVARALMGEFRTFDRVARYGGDEFVAILPNADLDSAAAAAERALEHLRAIPSFEIAPGVSASIGVAQWRAPMSVAQLLNACDEALLRSKRDGKGRVTRSA